VSIPALTGLILAGGRSIRMGRDKASVEFEGEPLAARVARRLAVVCDEVLVASGDGLRLAWLELPQVADPTPDRGPLGGIVAGLEAASTDLVAVVAVDMPFASGTLFRLLAGDRVDEDAVLPVTLRGAEPLHGVYARTAVTVLRARLDGGERAVHRALEACRVRYVEEDEWRTVDPSGRFASNVNLPDDLMALRSDPPASGGN
jgi:molybdopterin-guanine dinucleotide biosynthesis protein A